MTTEEFLRDICPNHTDKSKWNKSELLHILELHTEQLRKHAVIKSVCSCGNQSVEEYHPSCSLKCALCKHEETEKLYCEVGWSIEGKRCKKCKQTVL